MEHIEHKDFIIIFMCDILFENMKDIDATGCV